MNILCIPTALFYDTSLFIQMIATYICITIFTWLWIEKLGSDTFFVNIVLLYTIFTVFCTCKDTSDILQSKCNSINISIFSTTLTNCLIKSWCCYIVTVSFIGRENWSTGKKPVTCRSRWQTLSHNAVSSTPRHERDSNS
jgi:hypothetical protein